MGVYSFSISQIPLVLQGEKMTDHSIKNFSNNELVQSLANYFADDRRINHIILLHLKEIQSRHLYADFGYPNLFTMLIQHFHQSESAANQRIQALRLMNDVPEVANRLIAGKLNLSTLAMAQRQIRREEKTTGTKITTTQKTEIVQRISCKTMHEAEKELMALLPESAKTMPIHERRISADSTRLSLTVPDRVKDKLEKLKTRWAAANPHMDYLEIIERSLDMTLAKVDPIQFKSKQPQVAKIKQRATDSVAQVVEVETPQNTQNSKPSKLQPKSANRRKTYYSIHIDKLLWSRANSQCEFVDASTGQRCTSRFGMERDHILPLGKGGSNEIQNLRLLCRAHNLLMARRHFGAKKIQRSAEQNLA